MNIDDIKMLAMQNNSVIPLKKKVIVIDSGKKKEVSENTKRLIEIEWKKLTEQYSNIFNGPNYCVDQVELVDEQIIHKCSRSSYSHYRCSRIHDLGKDICRNPYGAVYLVTRDGYLVIALQGGDSENVGKIQGIGGGMSAEDTQMGNNILNPENTALRELEEEAGKEIRNSINRTEPGYLITDGIKFGIVTLAYSNMGKNEMEKSFLLFKEESGNNELDRLLFWNKETLEDIVQYETKQDLGVVQLIRLFLDDFNSAKAH